MTTLSDKRPVTAPLVDEPRGVGRAFVALRHRNFRLFWSSQLISLIGTWMQSTAQSWLVLELTHSALWLGVVGALQFLPIMLFALFGGVLADRVPKRTLLLCTQSAAAIQAVVLWILVFTGHIQLWEVLVLATMLGLTNSVDMPTRQAFVVEMVGRDSLPNAIALNSSIFNMARVLGPGLGGLLIALLGVTPLFLLNAMSFIPVIIAIALIDTTRLYGRPAKNTVVPKQGTFKSLREGLIYIRQTPAVLMVITVIGAVSLFGINFNVTLPLFATDILHSGAAGFGFISSGIGLGALASALWIAYGNKTPSIPKMLIGAVLFSILLIFFAISHLYWLSLILIAAVGFAQISFSATANTAIQTVTPDHLRGRVMSVYMLVFAGSTPLGNLFVGVLAHVYNVSLATLVCGGISLIAALIGWFLRKSAEQDVTETIAAE